ncbi:MAG: hypothetical protein NZL83_04870 [Candidatus Absconditabacterales bacterium]|nr:hypothetical protein [Candidatus Absconditabacterales bacterium]
MVILLIAFLAFPVWGQLTTPTKRENVAVGSYIPIVDAVAFDADVMINDEIMVDYDDKERYRTYTRLQVHKGKWDRIDAIVDRYQTFVPGSIYRISGISTEKNDGVVLVPDMRSMIIYDSWLHYGVSEYGWGMFLIVLIGGLGGFFFWLPGGRVLWYKGWFTSSPLIKEKASSNDL